MPSPGPPPAADTFEASKCAWITARAVASFIRNSFPERHCRAAWWRWGLRSSCSVRVSEDVGGDDPALVLADVGQRPDAGHVADRPQALAGAHLCVDRDSAAVVGLQDVVLPVAPGRGRVRL